MKKIIYTMIVALALLNTTGCTDESTFPINLDELELSGVPFAADLTSDVITDINKLDPSGSSFSKTYSIDSPKAGKDVTRIDVFVSLSRSIDLLVEETLLKSYDSTTFDMTGELPTVDISITGAELISTLNIDTSLLEGGEVFNYRLALTNDQGTFSDINSNFDNQSADHTFSSTVVCLLNEVPAGEWVIDMQDAYGDGWQSTTPNGGGPGITVTLSDGTVFEIGLCTPYEDPGYDCTEGSSSGTRIITIPENIASAEWVFNGDNWGEMAYQIYAPSGNQVASATTGNGTVGVIALNLCNE